MIIQSTDGHFYRNPVIDLGDRKLVCDDTNGVRLIRQKYVTWRVANHGLRELGITLKQAGDPELIDHIFNGQLCPSVAFSVIVKKPIPTPTAFDTDIVAFTPDDSEETLLWE